MENVETTAPPAQPAAPNSALLDHVETNAHAAAGNLKADPGTLAQPLGEAPIGQGNAAREEDPFKTEINKEKQRQASEKARAGAQGGAKPGSGPAPGPSLVENPGLKDLPPEKKQEAAANLAKLTMFGYEKLHALADKKLQISEKKMLEIRTEGKIDVDGIQIPVEGGVVGFPEFIALYNQQTKGTLTVDREFREDVEPVLTSVLAKHGAGISEEQYLLGAFASHLAVGIQKFIAQRSTMNAIFAFALKMTKDQREGAYQGPVVPMHAVPPQAPPPPPTQPGAAAPGPLAPADVPAGQGQRPGALVIYPDDPRHPDYVDPGGAAHGEFVLPEWGTKEKRKALREAARATQARRVSDIDASEPDKRQRVGRKNTKKAGKGSQG